MLDTDLWWTQIYVGRRYMLDTDICWTQIYGGHRSVLDTDLRWSTGPSWVTFSTIFGLFPGGPRSVPGRFFINRKALQIGSRGVLSNVFSIFSEMFRKVPRSFSGTPGLFLGTFGKKKMVWGT